MASASHANVFGESTLRATPAEQQAAAAASSTGAAAAAGGANVQELQLAGVVGFNGRVPHGLVLHPNDQHLIYPLGSTIVVRDLVNHTQTFLHRGGHDRAVSCLAISASGKWLASGQETHMGFNATCIIWNLETFEPVHRLQLHKGKVQDLAFSPNERFLATLGGRDDNKLVIWDVESGAAICGASAANETTNTVRFFNHSDSMLVTGGHYNLRVWAFDLANRKIRPADCQLGQLKRVIHSISIDESDEFMYCGTATGDLLQVSLGPNLFKASGPAKKPFQLGITCVMRTRKGNYVVGSGDGSIALIKKDGLTVVRRAQVNGAVTSLVLNAAGDHFFVGTDQCNQYLVNASTFELELRNTCHQGRIADIAFPQGFSELFATCGGPDIRVWNAKTRNELLRIQVPNLNCLCVAFMPDGKSIVSGWDDGKIRAFKPQSGALLYCISDAHLGGVTALACTSDCRAIVSGGEGGQVRVWSIERSVQRMLASMKEHKGRVNCIRINGSDSECVSASADGSCIVWSLQRFVRVTCLFASTQFRSIVYHPDESQLVTTGTDRKLTFWDVADGNPIRILDGSLHHSLNTLAVSADGERFVTGGGDKVVKVFAYDEGVLGARGVGHSGEISQVVIAPDQRTLVSIGDEGAIFIWHFPHFAVDDQGNVVSPRAGAGEEYGQGYDDEEQLAPSFRSGASFGSPQQQQVPSQRTAKASPHQYEEKSNGQSARSTASAASAAAAASSQRRTPGGAAASSRRF